jgi:hypothetical protein
MTPKNKAEELINSYRIILMNEDTECGNEILCTSIAKQCALIAVDELIKEARFSSEYIEEVFFTTGYYDKQDYWQEVKQEIEKL